MYKPCVEAKQRSHSAKAYLGCDTCKLKNCDLNKIKSVNKFNDFRNVKKAKKAFQEMDRDRGREVRKTKIKLTDLCDEDKKRIMELVEELTRYAEKNQELRESLECCQKTRVEQQEYIIQQAKTHLEEKSYYASEINRHKLKIDLLESDLQCKASQWEHQEKVLESEIAYLAKAFQKSMREKNELNEQVNQMSTCLKQSLDAFKKLKMEVNQIKLQEIKKFKSVSSQTETKSNMEDMEDDDDDDDDDDDVVCAAECDPDAVNSKSSLDIINDKLEHVYQMLMKKSQSITKDNCKLVDLDIGSFLKNKKSGKDGDRKKQGQCPDFQDDPITEESEDENEENRYKFLKPFDQCSKTSVQAEKILKKIENPLSLIVNECAQKLDRNKVGNLKQKEAPRYFDVITTNFLQTNILHNNDAFKKSEDRRSDEDRLLEELFYSERNSNLDLESVSKSKGKPCKTQTTLQSVYNMF